MSTHGRAAVLFAAACGAQPQPEPARMVTVRDVGLDVPIRVDVPERGAPLPTEVRVIPDAILVAVRAREAWLARNQGDRDGTRERYEIEVGEIYFAYGHFREAIPHLRAIVQTSCMLKTSPYAGELWERILKTCVALHDEACARDVAGDPNRISCDPSSP